VNSPESGVAKSEKKAEVHGAAAKGALAPTLEHGNQSNEEDHNRECCGAFDPHSSTSRASLPFGPAIVKGRESRCLVIADRLREIGAKSDRLRRIGLAVTAGELGYNSANFGSSAGRM
jgi:hypothetical protein